MILLLVDDKFPQIAVRIPKVHAGCGPPRAGDVARRTNVIDSTVAQVLLSFLNRAAPYQTKIGISLKSCGLSSWTEKARETKL